MAATSMMKEYVKRQLKYWVDNFKDDQLPRDFNSKSFARAQITLHKITLKPDKIAALLHVPAPLIVTRATCSELTLKVPSWQLAEKFVQEPLSLRLGDLFVDVKHIDECDDHVRRDSVARARAASLEPDPLGSIASMYQFATVISERLELTVENMSLKLYERQALRVRVELSRFHARTTNALWQDMRDLTDCVDRSPDGLLKTRFKFVSAQCSVYLHETPASTDKDGSPAPIRLLRDHAIAMRVTLFGHRKTKQDNWQVLSRVVDLNLETLPFDLDTAQVRQVYELYKTLARWMHEAPAHAADGEVGSVGALGGLDGLLPHQMVRGPLTPTRKPTTTASEVKDATSPAEEEDGGDDANTFALQVTVRFTAHVLLRVRSVQLAVIAQHAALNWIQHDNAEAATEMQLTVHDLSVRHKEKVLLHVKPARDVLQLKRLPGPSASVFVKWHLQKLGIHLEKDMAVLANELFHSLNEIEQAATITCGTCHHKIRLDTIETHVCSAASPPSSPHSGRHSSDDRGSAALDTPSETVLVDSTQIPKLRLVLVLDELEVIADSFLFRSVQDLARLAAEPDPAPTPAQRFVLSLKDWSVSTESKEFVGDAIFVPVLPLAFQMLECTIRGCGCVHRQQQRQKRRHKPVDEDTDHVPGCGHGSRALPRWPDRVFAELGQLAVRATNNTTKTETFLRADGASLRLSFSDGQRVCPRSTPQMSCFFHVERIRCQMEHSTYQRVRNVVMQLQDPLEGHAITALTLFFAVMEIRNVELTLLDDASQSARLKAQFRHVGGVADNHQGHLALQTNFDFRALLQSDSVTFDFSSVASTAEDDASGDATPHTTTTTTKRERRRQREEALRSSSAERIQRVFRGFVAERRRRLDQELRRLTREDEEALEDEGVSPTQREASLKLSNAASESETCAAGGSSPRRKSGSKPALFGTAGEDLAAMNPMKMVAAAGVLKDGVLGFVKAKQQMIESEMTDFALQSKESASRFIPKYSAVKNLLSPKTASGSSSGSSPTKGVVPGVMTTAREESMTDKNAEVRGVEADSGDQSGPPARQVSTDGSRTSSKASSRADQHESQSHDHENGHEREEGAEEEEGEDEDEEDDEEEEDKDKQSDAAGDSGEKDEDKEHSGADEDAADEERQEKEVVADRELSPPPLSATESLLASLPPVVRLLVQVQEHRMCVPIDPRATVSALCREIVRRFNEMFAQHGVIAHVALQNRQGGVLAGSDVIALVCDTAAAARDTVLFAYPHVEDATVKSVVRVDLFSTTEGSHSPGKEPMTGKSGNFHAKKATSAAFARCSKLPLPLVVALLANESERDLLRHVLKDGAAGADEWPELALNTSFLDPTRDMLQVEVRWPGGVATHSLEVTNRDAFLLCLQQLGLCTSRENSKHVGKVLRDRLKMDPSKNPLIRAACLASPEFQHDMESSGETDAETVPAAASYESLKEIVQEDFGVYTRSREE